MHSVHYTTATFQPKFQQGEEVYFFHVGPNDNPVLVKGYIHQPVIPNRFSIPSAPCFKDGVCQIGLNVNWIVVEDKAQAMDRYVSCETYVLSDARLFRNKRDAIASLTP